MNDRLALIEARWREAGCGDADKAWLIEEVKRLRAALALLALVGDFETLMSSAIHTAPATEPPR